MLPRDMAEFIYARIGSGRYTSVSKLVWDRVRALMDQDAALERWLREDVVAGHQEYLDDPSKGVPAAKALSRFKVRRACRIWS